MVEVSDTGSGIPAQILPRIFDPFLTTKPIDQGTGLGLPICHRIVTGLGGEISVESAPGRTVVRVLLPALSAEAAASVRPTRDQPRPRRGRILVIGDEDMLIRAVVRMLEEEHTVEGTTDARHALDRIRRGERFDLILCDLMMGLMSGLYAELSAWAPDQAAKILFMTGGAFSDSVRSFLERVQNPHLEKPFDANALRLVLPAFCPDADPSL